jgi:hypothetical protein
MPAAGNRNVRPLQGGIQIEHQSGPTIRTGTLGLVIAYEGESAFVTAGHVVGMPEDFVGQPTHDTWVGRVLENFGDSGVDLAVVGILAGVGSEVGRVWTGDGQFVTVQFAKDARPAKGERVVLQGAVSGNVEGTVLEPDADIKDKSTGRDEMHVVLVEYAGAVTNGDSGAPVMTALADGALCYGVHGGKVDYQERTVDWFAPFENIGWD